MMLRSTHSLSQIRPRLQRSRHSYRSLRALSFKLPRNITYIELGEVITTPKDFMANQRRLWAIRYQWALKFTPLLLLLLSYKSITYPFVIIYLRICAKKCKQERFAPRRSLRHFWFHFLEEPTSFRKLSIFSLLNTVLQPWGNFTNDSGTSMQPTFASNHQFTFTTWVHRSGAGIQRGSVISMLKPKAFGRPECMNKRRAALEGDTFRLQSFNSDRRNPPKKRIVVVGFSHTVFLSLQLTQSTGAKRALFCAW